jgi:hypothetical protein
MEKHRHYEEITYLYDTEEEKESHSQEMKMNGYEDTGKHSMRLNSMFSEPEYSLCGVYYKYHA